LQFLQPDSQSFEDKWVLKILVDRALRRAMPKPAAQPRL
jgi:hypothetical protein